MDRMRERKQDERLGKSRDYLESPDDIRKLKHLADREEDLIELADHREELIAVAEDKKWWSGTHKKIKMALAYFAGLIAAVVGTITILEKLRGK